MKTKQGMIVNIPAQFVRLRISFLFQAELSIDRCLDVAQLREYYARLWPGNSAKVLFAMWPNKDTSGRRMFNVYPSERVRAFLQWHLFKKISLTVEQIEEAESCFCAFLSLLAGRGACPKDYLITMRMRLNAAAISFCNGLSLSSIQSLRKVEHLNSAPHLSLRAFSAASCGLLPDIMTQEDVLTIVTRIVSPQESKE